MSTPEVSVIIPFFNRREYLRRAVSSLLAEGLTSLEVIAVDDGSNDGSADTISDLPIRVLRKKKKEGPSGARNLGLEAARGGLITFLDSDDLLVPGGLRWRADWLESHPQDTVVGGMVGGFIDEHDKPLPAPFEPREIPPVIEMGFLREGGVAFPGCSLYLYRRSLIEKVGRFDESLGVGEDHDYLIRILNVTPISFFQKPVIYYRMHRDNLSVEKWKGKIRCTRRTMAAMVAVFQSHGLNIGREP